VSEDPVCEHFQHAAEIIGRRWNPQIVRVLLRGPARYRDLKAAIPGISDHLLSQRLRELERERVLTRTVEREGPIRVAYALTEAGRDFVPLVEALGIWGQKWTRRQLKAHEIDLGLLIWSLESNANPAAFGEKRCLIRLELSDQIDAKRLWWFLNQKGRCELCVDDPGGEVNLYMSCTLSDAIYIVRGDLSVETAIRSQRLEIIGDGWARAAFTQWLNLGPLTQVTSRRAVK